MWLILAKEKWHTMFMLFTVNNIAVLQRFVSPVTSLHDLSPVLNVSLFHRLIKLKKKICFWIMEKVKLSWETTYSLVYRCSLCKNLSFSIKCIFSLHVNSSFRKFVYYLLCHDLLKKYCLVSKMHFKKKNVLEYCIE